MIQSWFLQKASANVSTYLTGWLADFIMHFFLDITVIYLRIERLNLILLPSDGPVNHNGRLKFPAVKKEQQNKIPWWISHIPFMQTTSKFHLSSLNTNQLWGIGGSSNVSFSLVTSWSRNHLGIPIYMVQSASIIVFSSTCIKLQSGRCQKISNC